jgi:N-acetylglutamate synthase-like GNAT family acetyltransferase
MPRLYLEEYTQALTGKAICIACREGILRDHFDALVSDLKFLNRHRLRTTLYHNIANRTANHRYFKLLEKRLPETRIVRVMPEVDFYSYVLDHEERVHKLIFLERKALIDQHGQKINAVTTQTVRQSIGAWGDLIANVNFRGALERICVRIDQGLYDRVHILPAGKNAIKHELFTIEGHGTLIANNFVERFHPVATQGDLALIQGILNLYKHEGFLRPRTEAYLNANRNNFFVTLIDDIVVGCVEKKIVDARTAEIGALAISSRFRNQRIGLFTVQAFIDAMRQQGFTRFISLTNNPTLKRLYLTMGFASAARPEYQRRQRESPGVTLFFKSIE